MGGRVVLVAVISPLGSVYRGEIIVAWLALIVDCRQIEGSAV